MLSAVEGHITLLYSILLLYYFTTHYTAHDDGGTCCQPVLYICFGMGWSGEVLTFLFLFSDTLCPTYEYVICV